MERLDDLLSELGRRQRASVPALPPPPAYAAPRPSGRWWLWGGAAAAVALLFMTAGRPAPPRAAAPAPEAARAARPVSPASSGPSSVAVRTGVPVPVAPAPPRAVEWRTEFIRVPAAEALPLPQAATVVRVEFPPEALAGYGLIASGPAVPSTIRADLLVGDDGLARAIRLVQ